MPHGYTNAAPGWPICNVHDGAANAAETGDVAAPPAATIIAPMVTATVAAMRPLRCLRPENIVLPSSVNPRPCADHRTVRKWLLGPDRGPQQPGQRERD